MATPGQTVGPFFEYALRYPSGEHLVPAGHPTALRLAGHVLDGAGAPVPDALLELWQPDPEGRIVQQSGSLHRDGWTFTGWGRALTDNTGRYSFTTLPPGPLAAGRPAFFALAVFARGLLHRLLTRVYLPVDEEAVFADEPLLASLPAGRRRTLIAVKDDDEQLRFDVRLQGEGETVFLRYPGDRQGRHAVRADRRARS